MQIILISLLVEDKVTDNLVVVPPDQYIIPVEGKVAEAMLMLLDNLILVVVEVLLLLQKHQKVIEVAS